MQKLIEYQDCYDTRAPKFKENIHQFQIFGALGDEPVLGDLSIVEICDLCGNATSTFVEIDSLIVCEDCLEDLDLEMNENVSCDLCAICGWPINRPIPKQVLRKIFDFVTEYSKSVEGSIILRKKLAKILLKDKVYLCRYDLYYLIKDILENFDEKLAKEFEERFAKQFDFQGSLIS